MGKLTRAQFAARIKSEYPEYAQMPDEDLVTRVLSKHPKWQDLVETSAPVQSQPTVPSAPPLTQAQINERMNARRRAQLTAEEKPAGGVASRFLDRFKQASALTNIYNPVQEMWEGIQSGDMGRAGMGALSTFIPPVGMAVQGAIDGGKVSGEQFDSAGNDFATGHPVRGAVRAGSGALAFLGGVAPIIPEVKSVDVAGKTLALTRAGITEIGSMAAPVVNDTIDGNYAGALGTLSSTLVNSRGAHGLTKLSGMEYAGKTLQNLPENSNTTQLQALVETTPEGKALLQPVRKKHHDAQMADFEDRKDVAKTQYAEDKETAAFGTLRAMGPSPLGRSKQNAENARNFRENKIDRAKEVFDRLVDGTERVDADPSLDGMGKIPPMETTQHKTSTGEKVSTRKGTFFVDQSPMQERANQLLAEVTNSNVGDLVKGEVADQLKGILDPGAKLVDFRTAWNNIKLLGQTARSLEARGGIASGAVRELLGAAKESLNASFDRGLAEGRLTELQVREYKQAITDYALMHDPVIQKFTTGDVDIWQKYGNIVQPDELQRLRDILPKPIVDNMRKARFAALLSNGLQRKTETLSNGTKVSTWELDPSAAERDQWVNDSINGTGAWTLTGPEKAKFRKLVAALDIPEPPELREEAPQMYDPSSRTAGTVGASLIKWRRAVAYLALSLGYGGTFGTAAAMGALMTPGLVAKAILDGRMGDKMVKYAQALKSGNVREAALYVGAIQSYAAQAQAVDQRKKQDKEKSSIPAPNPKLTPPPTQQ